MADNENKKPKSLKELLWQLPNHIKIMMIVSTFFLVFSFLLNVSNEFDEPKFTVYTLSSEELNGDTYTSRTTFDDSDMWETEPYSASDNTSVATTAVQTETIPETTSVVQFPLNINSATIDELIQIDGVGTVTAEKIVDYRNKYGYFYDYNELLNVNGIGEKKLANLMEYVYISDELLNLSTTVYTEETTVTTIPFTETRITETVTVTAETTETTEPETVTEEFELIIEEFESDDEFEQENDDTFEDNFEYEYEETITVTTERYVKFPIELNTATAEELMFIDGIGEYTAYKIIEYANMYGFYSVEDLLNVDGIGNAKLVLIAPYVYVNSSMLPPKTEFTTRETEAFTEYTEPFSETTIPKVNINTCGKYELMQLPGIDEGLASKIIEFRETIGGYIKIEELSLVDGMTNDKLSAIWNYIYI